MRNKYAKQIEALKIKAPRGEYVTVESIIDLMEWHKKSWCNNRIVSNIMKRAGFVFIRQDPYHYLGRIHSRGIWLFPED